MPTNNEASKLKDLYCDDACIRSAILITCFTKDISRGDSRIPVVLQANYVVFPEELVVSRG